MFRSSHSAKRSAGFTLVELLTVMTIIGILAALVLGTFKFAQEKGARSRAEAEIKAMEAALESYKADNGDYPRGAASDSLNPNLSTVSPTAAGVLNSSRVLYQALSGDGDNLLGGSTLSNGQVDPGKKQYFEFKPNQLAPSSGYYVVDPWGYSYGYSTLYKKDVESGTNPPKGNNPTFDLFSTGGVTTGTDKGKWLKNW